MSKDHKHNEKPLKEAIDSFLKVYKLDKRYHQVEVTKAWERAMGTYIQSKTRSVYLSGSVLRVKLESSVISNEIMSEKSKVIEGLNKTIGRHLIEDIVFVE